MNTILCLDIGSGTQDALLYRPGLTLENCPKFVLPAPARLVGARIAELTRRGLPVHLHGRNMGGGFFKAVKAHLAAGLAVSAQPRAALALSDDPPSLARHGITLSETCPSGHVPVYQADYDPGYWRGLLAQAGLDQPDMVLACAQDHGHHPGQSSRIGRFRLWQDALERTSGRLEDMLYAVPPPEFTRLAELHEATGGGPVMDTGPAAALGALFDADVRRAAATDGALLVNMGNSHILGLLVKGDRLCGVFEHHTGMLSPLDLLRQLELFRAGRASHEEVFNSGGHGCALNGQPCAFPQTFVIGPRRADLSGLDAVHPSPGGDMMLTGCFGLLSAWKRNKGEELSA